MASTKAKRTRAPGPEDLAARRIAYPPGNMLPAKPHQRTRIPDVRGSDGRLHVYEIAGLNDPNMPDDKKSWHYARIMRENTKALLLTELGSEWELSDAIDSDDETVTVAQLMAPATRYKKGMAPKKPTKSPKEWKATDPTPPPPVTEKPLTKPAVRSRPKGATKSRAPAYIDRENQEAMAFLQKERDVMNALGLGSTKEAIKKAELMDDKMPGPVKEWKVARLMREKAKAMSRYEDGSEWEFSDEAASDDDTVTLEDLYSPMQRYKKGTAPKKYPTKAEKGQGSANASPSIQHKTAQSPAKQPRGPNELMLQTIAALGAPVKPEWLEEVRQLDRDMALASSGNQKDLYEFNVKRPSDGVKTAKCPNGGSPSSIPNVTVEDAAECSVQSRPATASKKTPSATTNAKEKKASAAQTPTTKSAVVGSTNTQPPTKPIPATNVAGINACVGMPDWLRKTALESAPEMDSMGIESLDQAMDRYGVHDKNISQVEKSTRLHKLILERNEIAERLRPGENHWPNPEELIKPFEPSILRMPLAPKHPNKSGEKCCSGKATTPATTKVTTKMKTQAKATTKTKTKTSPKSKSLHQQPSSAPQSQAQAVKRKVPPPAPIATSSKTVWYDESEYPTSPASSSSSRLSNLSADEQFHCNLSRAIRAEALRRGADLEKQFDAQLMTIFTLAYQAYPCPPPISVFYGGAPACCCCDHRYADTGSRFVYAIKSIADPMHLEPGMWGLSVQEVDAIRGIIFVRYIAGWYERDRNDPSLPLFPELGDFDYTSALKGKGDRKGKGKSTCT